MPCDGEPCSVPSQSDCPIHPCDSTLPAQSQDVARRPLVESRRGPRSPASPSHQHRHHSLYKQPSMVSSSHVCSALQFMRYFQNIHPLVLTFSRGPWHILLYIRKIASLHLVPNSKGMCPGKPPWLPPEQK